MVRGVKRFSVNGHEATPVMRKGYAVVTREWKPGDRIELELPMEPQRVIADSRITATRDLVAIKHGPLVYSVETEDNANLRRKLADAPLKTEWRPDLLGGVMVIEGKWQDGAPMLAIPNFARSNRVGPPHDYPVGDEAEEKPGSEPPIETKVWI